jgi:spectinomycin phosphotransferase
VLVPPQDLDEERLAAAVAAHYGITGLAPEFVPLGEDSWSYRCGDWWVSLRRDLRGHTPAAYETAARLKAAGLEFVLAPVAGRDGRVVQQVDGYPMVVFPYVDVSQLADAPPDAQEIETVVTMLTRVHGTAIDTDLPAEDYTLSFEHDLDVTLDAVTRRPVDAGPYTGPLHHLLSRHRAAMAAMRAEIANLARACRAAAAPAVLTHGEPIPSNVLRYAGGLLLADWGDAMWGPPERDWSHVARTLGAAPTCDPMRRRFYDLKWILSEIAEYATTFLQEHAGHADDAAMWRRLLRYLPGEA